jgi:putative acetyltransferase
MNLQVRRARERDRAPLLDLWERSVRATHAFLGEDDVVTLRPAVAQELAGGAVDWWVAQADDGALVGFLGYSANTIEGLFIDPAHRHRGAGRFLVDHAQRLSPGALSVGVNEQNAAARRFYEALGFVVAGRSATDDAGRPFPVLHMRRAAPATR